MQLGKKVMKMTGISRMNFDDLKRHCWRTYGIMISWDTSYRPKDRRKSQGYIIEVPSIHACEDHDEIDLKDVTVYRCTYANDISRYITRLDKDFLQKLKELMTEL